MEWTWTWTDRMSERGKVRLRKKQHTDRTGGEKESALISPRTNEQRKEDFIRHVLRKQLYKGQ